MKRKKFHTNLPPLSVYIYLDESRLIYMKIYLYDYPINNTMNTKYQSGILQSYPLISIWMITVTSPRKWCTYEQCNRLQRRLLHLVWPIASRTFHTGSFRSQYDSNHVDIVHIASSLHSTASHRHMPLWAK